jgi:hypothetical protein
MGAEAKADCMKRFPQCQLWRGIGGADQRHALGSICLGQDVHHASLTAQS